MLSLSFNPFPRITTARLELKQITEGDASALFRLRSDENLMRYIDRPRAANLNDALELIRRIDNDLEKNDGLTWGIFLKQDAGAGLIGTIGFWRIEKNNYRAEIGYMLDSAHHRKGLMQEAMTAVLDFGFDNLQFHSVQANVNPGNDASAAMLEKNGFVKEGYFRENFFFNGRFLDSVIYSLLKSEWQPRYPTKTIGH